MKKYNSIYYLLFILLIMGAFASMAQNSYGIKIMGGVAFAFGLVFLVEFISVLRRNEKKDVNTLIEPLCLCLLSFIFGLRVFYIHFPYIEILFVVAGLVLVLIYLRKVIPRFRHFRPKNNYLAILILVFHLSIILFLISLAMIPFAPKISELTGAMALVLLLCFIVAAVFKRVLMVDGEKVSAFSIVTHFKDYSIIIVSLFLLFSLYLGLNKIGMLPGIYTDEFPRAYYELVDRAALKKEKPVGGRYKHEDFKEKYDQFLRNVKANHQ